MKPICIEVLPQKEDDIPKMMSQISEFPRGGGRSALLMQEYKYQRDCLKKENIRLKNENDRFRSENNDLQDEIDALEEEIVNLQGMS